jgi:hypothetical protein
MSGDQLASSFGDPNAHHPPTPQQTPSAAVFPSPVFETPKINLASLSDSGDWTPRFAEDYSVFNSTPGNLRGTSGHFADFPTGTPAGSSTAAHKRLLSAESIDLVAHAAHLPPNPSAPHPGIALANTPRDYTAQPKPEKTSTSSTARSSKKVRCDSAHDPPVSQTVTPPPSAHKGSRKLAPKLNMQNDQGFAQPDFTGVSQHDLQAMMGNPDDLYSYPLSAPVTGPDSFWDPTMSMAMDLSFTAGTTLFQTPAPGLPRGQAFEWNGDLPLFQDPLAPPLMSPDIMGQVRRDPVRREVAIAPKPPPPAQASGSADTSKAASFNAQSHGSMFNGGAVNPDLLFSRPQTSAVDAMFNTADQHGAFSMASADMREQGSGDTRRKTIDMNGRNGKMPERALASSPVKGSTRPGLGRSFSENRGKKGLGRGSTAPLAPVARSASGGSIVEPSSRPVRPSGRSSPLKNQHRLTELASIPETFPQPSARASVKFTIDSQGRARAESTMTNTELEIERPISRSHSTHSLSKRASWQFSDDDESSDDEPIIIPSRHNSFHSFALPDPRKPVGSIFHSSRRSISDNSTSTSTTADGLNAPLVEPESEAETLMNEHVDLVGDAASELRKVVQHRQKRTGQTSSSKSQRHLAAPFQGRPGGTISPTHLTELSQGSDADTIRCVCHKKEARGGDGFMVQWYDSSRSRAVAAA